RAVDGLEARHARCRAVSNVFSRGRAHRARLSVVTNGSVSETHKFSTCQILGVRFFNGDVDEAIAFISGRRGFLVAPSGTCFARLKEDESYRRAIIAADLAIADSGLMVLLWRLLQRENVNRISGLKYLKRLLERLKREDAKVFWVVPSENAREKLLE